MRRKSSETDFLRMFDNELVKKAIKKVTEVLEDTVAKRAEVLNAADKIIKYKFMFQSEIRQRAIDQIELESRQLKLEEQKIKMERLRGASNPDLPQEKNTQNYSMVYSPEDKPEGYYDDEEEDLYDDVKEA